MTRAGAAAGGAERRGDGVRRRVVEEILRSLRDIRFGSLEIVIHDSRVVRVERRERLKLDDGDAPAEALGR